MNVIQPFRIKAKSIIKYNVRCIVCGRIFEFARTRPNDKIFICMRCIAEINGLEKIVQNYKPGGQDYARQNE